MSNLLNTASLVVTPNSYKEGTLFSVIPNTGAGDMTVVRATTATRVNSAGLVEIVPYNLFQYSEDFSNGYWTKTNATITTNTTAAPNFTLTADTITDNATNGQHKVQTAALSDLVTGASFVASAYIKANTATRACVYAYGTSLGVGVDLLTGNQITVSGLTNASPGQVTISNVGNGWYYIELRATVAGAFSIAIMMVSGTDFAYAGSGNSLYYWGAQLTEGTIAKPYQKTETRLNIPRLDYSKGTCPSLLVEPQRTNLLNYSEEFNNSYWTTTATFVSVSANAAIAPNGTLTADAVNEDTTNNLHYVGTQNPMALSASTYTLSVYAKKVNRDWLDLSLYDGTTARHAWFNISTGVIGTVQSGTTATIIDAGNGWYRCSISMVMSASNVNFLGLGLSNANGVSTYTGNGLTACYMWGAQLELGSYSTSYIPTTSASVTRNADVISKTGISSLIGQFEGTMVFNINVVQPTGLGVQLLLKVSNDSETQLFIVSYVDNTGKIAFDFYIAGTYTFSLFGASAVSAGLNTVGITYKTGSYKLYINGSQVATSTNSTAITNTISKLSLGSGSAPMYYNFVSVWKEALNDEQLESLTGTGFNSYAAMASFYNYTLQ